MAKRAPAHEEPYRPLLDPTVINAALTKTTASSPLPQVTQNMPVAPSPKVLEIQRPEPPKTLAAARAGTLAEPEAPRRAAGEGRVTAPEYAEKFDQEKRLLLTRTESAALDRLVIALAGRLGAQVKLSHVLRALVRLLLNAEGEVDRRAGEAPLMDRPPNGDAKALQRFEAEIARILGAAVRDSGPLR